MRTGTGRFGPPARRRLELLVPGVGPDSGLGEQAHLGPGLDQAAARRASLVPCTEQRRARCVYVPYAEKQSDPVLRGPSGLRAAGRDPSHEGTVQYVPYTTILGDSGHYLGVYLPAGYDADRAEPYKVAYVAHGIFGDETDFLVPGNVPNILDNMTARGEIEPTVVVTMGNHFTGTSLGFGSYNRSNAANNLVQTILPLVEDRATTSRPSATDAPTRASRSAEGRAAM